MYAVAAPALDPSGSAEPSASGDYYCDANQVGGSWCTEVDLIEANTAAMAATPHACQQATSTGFVPSCDKGGCSMNSKGTPGQFGPGASFSINTLQPFTVSTAFPADASGQLLSVVTTVTQGSASFVMDHSSASCSKGGSASYFSNMTSPLAAGLVPVMSVWGDSSSGSDMSWLDVPPCSAAVGCSQGVKAVFSAISVAEL